MGELIRRKQFLSSQNLGDEQNPTPDARRYWLKLVFAGLKDILNTARAPALKNG